jgi:Cytochrome c554 and c-prime
MANRARGAGAFAAAGLLFVGLWSSGTASAQTLPQFGDAPHLGVTTCGGSTCHGAAEPGRNSNVLQNEAKTWAEKDKHARAYKVLLEPRSAQIARKLGLANAQTAEICLNCHADNVPEAKRGRQFDLAAGVGCDACHGAGTPWLGIHIAGGSHQDNVKAGLYPTDDPVARAKLCLSCHVGSQANKFVTHRIMGAGHPRMPFELATFTAKQPAHYVVDDDYIKRKGQPNGLQVWAIGQALQLNELMTAYLDPQRNRAGPYPELVFFDCAACHHLMSEPRWRPSAGSPGIGPGVVVFNDGNALMLRLLAERVDPALGRGLGEALQGLRRSVTENREASLRQATRLRDLSQQLIGKLAGREFGPEDVRALAAAIVDAGLARNEYTEHGAAEQAAEALEALSLAMRDLGGMTKGQAENAAAAAAKLKETTAREAAFRPEVFAAALREYRQRVAVGGR